MPDEQKLESATNLAATFAWIAVAAVAAYLLGVVLSWTLLRLGRRGALIRDVARLTRRSSRATLMVVASTVAVQRTSDPSSDPWRGWVDHTLLIALIVAITWLVTSLVGVAARRVVARFGGGDAQMTDADRYRRRVRTQVTMLHRLANAVVVMLGIAAVLTTFPAFSNIGTTLFASAGVLSVVAGLAAQTSLGAVFAGMQIAFSGAIRVGDVVVLEERFGRVEEITLTYVVVRLWDERRLVLPCTYFTTTPFENWTRSATEIMGTVDVDVDYSVPFDAMRLELDRLLSASELWDGRRGVLQVTDAVAGCVRVRMLVSAPNASALFDLRCEIREGIVDWLQRAEGVLPRYRIGSAGQSPDPDAERDGSGETGRVTSTLFSGSPEADERARAFDGHDADDSDGRAPAG